MAAAEPITISTTVADTLNRVPEATLLFRRRGFNPRIECGAMARVVTLGQVEATCGLHDSRRLMEELTASLRGEGR